MAVSCTAVLIPSVHSGLQSRTFPYLKTSSSFISNRSGINSILIGSLLTLLRQTVALEGHDSDCISELLIGEQNIYENILVATTRVPTFGIGLQEPVNGYQRLGSLRSFLDGQMVMPPPPPDPVIHDRELLAMKDNSETRNFLQSWGPIGVMCDTHFIVIFYKPKTALSNMTHLFTPDSHSSGASSHALSSSPTSQNSPAYQSDENLRAWVSTVGGSDVSPQSRSVISRAASPASSAAVSINSNLHLSRSFTDHLCRQPRASSFIFFAMNSRFWNPI